MPNTIRIDTKELNRMADAIAKAARTTENHVHLSVYRFALLIERKAKQKISHGPARSGKVYSVDGKRSRRSAAGEPAKTDKGSLVASIRPVFLGRFSAEVGSLDAIARHGGYMEDGTSRMEAHPWLAPTLKENQGAMADMLSAAITQGGLAR